MELKNFILRSPPTKYVPLTHPLRFPQNPQQKTPPTKSHFHPKPTGFSLNSNSSKNSQKTKQTVVDNDNDNDNKPNLDDDGFIKIERKQKIIHKNNN